ncbi:MAG: DUF2807 domain-containing protein [Alistipes sp.]|nr:DUF2807 domain-containing protein [Alistipes sp.]
MRQKILAAAISALLVVSSASAFTIKDGEGNKVKISPLGIKVEASSGEKVSISPLGVKAKDGEGAKVSVSPAGVKAKDGEGASVSVDVAGVDVVTDGETNTKTGIALANEHKIVMEARRSAMDFNEIEASKAIRVIVEERTTGNIIVRAPQSVIPYVSLKVKDGTLYATLLSGTPVSRRSNLLAEVYVPYNGKINEITTSAAARVIVKPTISCEELDLESTSASVIEVTAAAKEVSIDASGASTIKAVLATDDLDIDLSGASVATLTGQVTDAEIDLSGASTLRAEKMRTATLDLECSGASKASAIGVQCTAQASGASAINVECLQLLNASASGASSIIYSGDCQVNIISNTGASSIRKK